MNPSPPIINDPINKEDEKAIVAQARTIKEIEMDSGGNLVLKSFEDQFRVAKCFVQSGILPRAYNSPEKVVTAMQWAKELGLPPLTSLRQIAVINGTPNLFGDLPLSLVYRSGKLAYIKEYYIDVENREVSIENGNFHKEVIAHITIVRRIGETEEDYPISFSLEDAKRANLFKNDVWKQYPKRMLKYRSRSQALKDKFPDVLNGIAIKEYDMDIGPELPLRGRRREELPDDLVNLTKKLE